jgi:hypothetical protein
MGASSVMKSEMLTYPPTEEFEESLWLSIIAGSLEISENRGE